MKCDTEICPPGVLQNPSPVPASSPRMLQTSHALRGPPLTPQFIFTPQYCMAPPSLPPNLTAASPVSPATCMYPTTQLTGIYTACEKYFNILYIHPFCGSVYELR